MKSQRRWGISDGPNHYQPIQPNGIVRAIRIRCGGLHHHHKLPMIALLLNHSHCGYVFKTNDMDIDKLIGSPCRQCRGKILHENTRYIAVHWKWHSFYTHRIFGVFKKVLVMSKVGYCGVGETKTI